MQRVGHLKAESVHVLDGRLHSSLLSVGVELGELFHDAFVRAVLEGDPCGLQRPQHLVAGKRTRGPAQRYAFMRRTWMAFTSSASWPGPMISLEVWRLSALCLACHASRHPNTQHTCRVFRPLARSHGSYAPRRSERAFLPATAAAARNPHPSACAPSPLLGARAPALETPGPLT